MGQSKANTAELAELAKHGDIHAFSMLYETIYKDLYRFALYSLRNPEDAKDAVSEAVLDAYAQIQSLRSAEAFQGWMFRILSAKCKRKLKSYVNKSVPIEEEELIQPEVDYAERQDLYIAFQSLSEKERMIVNMSVVAGFQSKEIAQVLHMNSNTVRSIQKRALEKLKRILAV